MKCAAVVRTSQNGPFFIKSAFLPQCLLLLQYICYSEDPGEQPSMTMFYICCSESPGEQPGMTTLHEITCAGVVS